MHKKIFRGIAIFTGILLFPALLFAAQFKGQIQKISKKSHLIELQDKKTQKIRSVQFNENTKYKNANSIKDFIPNDVVLIEYEGSVATQITRILVKLPANRLYTLEDMKSLLQQKPSTYVLADARPGKAYNMGHIPTAVSLPVGKFEEKIKLLPKNKNMLLVFYCGGPT